MKALYTVFLGLATAVASQAGIVSSITLADFNTPTVLDFQSVPTGTISGTDPYFTDNGVSSITATGTGDGDTFDLRTNSSRALWLTGGNLAVADPNDGVLYDANPIYTINLANSAFLFGIGVHDQAGTYTVNFFQGATNVGTANFSNVDADLSQVYYQNTEAFDSVQISVTGGGFAIDNITLEAVPEPATFWLSGMGLVALGLRMRRKKA